MKTEKYPKLTIAGAGPGDIELVTIKTIKALQQADVVLYDALVNKELLKYVPLDALVIYVGKRNKYHTYTQEQINTLIVDLAFTRGHVVRLKGGDPFVFGRGQEEKKYAGAFNIETVVLPGISSSIGVPALNGIPVTHRGVSESFWVITGTTKENKLSKDVLIAAKTNATVVILMGLAKLKEITEVFKAAGKEDTAIAIIQNGSLPNQAIALGTIGTIVEIAEHENIKAPAVIVIGDVVKQHDDFPVALSNLNYLFN
ncbi:MAG TPA: uroporphyrinogen-III C-methyltransferase [Bacteroidia bacterium]|nr:uroporphyrinogen-III C-methyltransferase [Bacteroidia bacterium]